ncbi:hypothetical protein JCM11491_003003 [Sporobolomyces phaffii]
MRPQFKNGGGKKGMRQVTSKHQRKIILRPAPAREIDATTSSEGKGRASEEPGEDDDSHGAEYDDDQEEDDGSERYGYRESLQQQSLPLVGFSISVSGCRGQKEDLLKIAEDYGAFRHGGLQEDTTHLITDRAEGEKYKIALERRMTVMSPDWLPAMERDYRLLPLDGVIFCMTHFAKGEYKDEFKRLMMEAGADYSPRLDSTVTHLIVASPSAPRSQTPSSQKLLHALKNRQNLQPGFEVMWEGWAKEAIKFGGRREERDKVWIYREGGREPEEDLSWTVAEPPRRLLASTPHPKAPVLARTAAQPGPTRIPSQTSRDLVGGGQAATTTRKFTGYDTSILDSFEDEQGKRNAASTSHDVANGKILKKRRRTAGPDASQGGDPGQYFDVFGQVAHIKDRQAEVEASPFDLPHPDGLGLGLGVAEGGGEAELPVPPPGYSDADMVLEMRDGEVGLQRTKKSKSAIKAIASKRSIDDVKTLPKSITTFNAANQQRNAPDGGAQDDSGFLDNTESDGKLGISSSQASSVATDIFSGLTLAVMEIKARDPSVIAGIIEKGGGQVVVDASDDQLETADWIVVDFVEPPERFLNSRDPRVVSVCWIELCLWAERVVPVEDRILDRPIPYSCPVQGASGFQVHFSGFPEGDGPFMHHIRRFLHAVGASISLTFSRASTHLILFCLETDPSLSASDLDASENRKIEKARQWGKRICSMRDLRQEIADLAAERDTAVNARGMKGNGRECGREITNAVGRRNGGEESLAERDDGPLSDCVVYFSTKANIDRQSLADIVKDLGGTAARQYSDSVTHFVHFSDSSSSAGSSKESYKDLKLAKSRVGQGCSIVHPRWIEECGRTRSKASELDFPHTFDSKKGGQLFEAGMSMAPSPPRDSSRPPREDSDAVATEGTRARSSTSLTPTTKQKSRLDFDDDARRLEGGAQTIEKAPQSRSPTPRRRRSDSTRTEIVEEAEEEQEEEERTRSPRHRASPPAKSPSAPEAQLPISNHANTASTTYSTSNAANFESSHDDRSSIHALSAVPPRQTDEDNHERAQVEALRKREEMLRQQTDQLRLAMQPNAVETSKGARTKTSIFGRKQQSIPYLSPKKLSPTRTTSLPILLPSSSPSRHQHSRLGAAGEGAPAPPSSSIPYSQSQASTARPDVRVVYDEPEAIEAKARILKRQREAEEERARAARDAAAEGGRRVTRSAKKGMY